MYRNIRVRDKLRIRIHSVFTVREIADEISEHPPVHHRRCDDLGRCGGLCLGVREGDTTGVRSPNTLAVALLDPVAKGRIWGGEWSSEVALRPGIMHRCPAHVGDACFEAPTTSASMATDGATAGIYRVFGRRRFASAGNFLVRGHIPSGQF